MVVGVCQMAILMYPVVAADTVAVAALTRSTQAAQAIAHPDNIGQEVRQEARVLLPIRGVDMAAHHAALVRHHPVVVIIHIGIPAVVPAEVPTPHIMGVEDHQVVQAVVILPQVAVDLVGGIMDHVHANRLHHKAVTMYRHQVVAADFIGMPAFVLAAPTPHPPVEGPAVEDLPVADPVLPVLIG